jgi:hypothetical protein
MSINIHTFVLSLTGVVKTGWGILSFREGETLGAESEVACPIIFL